MDRIEERILGLIEENRDRILAFGRDIYDHAELGYREFETSARFIDHMQSLGLRTEKEIAITGVKAYMDSGRPGPTLALLGEMDGLPLPAHKHANPKTQAAHACGHHCQLTGVAGAAIALSDPEVRKALSGTCFFFAVPAEEYTELEYREELMREGKIGYSGGKCELIRIGAFDDVDICIAHHSSNEISFGNSGGNGFFSKKVSFYGRSAHAGAAPENGINALYAANLALQALGMNREAFADKDRIRINAVLTEGGSAPGVIPDLAQSEAMVRGKTIEAIEAASAVADRCYRAGAIAMGAGISIETRVGYLPEKGGMAPKELVEMARELFPDRDILDDPCKIHTMGSSDLGDLRSILPVIQMHTGGICGSLHQVDFDIVDEEEAYLLTSKLFALSAYRLLRNRAELAGECIRNYEPVFSGREEYCAYIDSKHTIYEEKVPDPEYGV